MKTIEKKVKALIERLIRLEALAERLVCFEDYAGSADMKDIAERNLQIAIECCLDIGKIIISDRRLSEPKDNKGIFTVLSEAGMIDPPTLVFLIPMAGTRNILVHGYDKIEDSLIYGILKEHLKDFHLFLRQVKSNYILPNSTANSSR